MKCEIKDATILIVADIKAQADELYNEECNFNNADPTTHMRAYSYDEILKMLFEEIKAELDKEVIKDD